ncbi:MAG TPA: 5'-3' exonuclease H3TH domain-containing protein [Steroidobacteraceae bacterium]|nr:5'-3' exonuclease H3TH domain-containing protein [Steroidobacteraceae bacterium]
MIFLVDASVYVFRAYYSMPPDMRDGDGNPVHALYGFARFLGDLIERERPEYMAVAFDASLATSFRNRIYPAYKANRDPAPLDLLLQFERCRAFCERLGIAWFDSSEFEADDIIGTLACRMRAEGLRVTIVSRDKDLAQLITPGDVYWDYAGNVRYRHGEIADRFGVAPERYADYLALTGDAVDNISGVPGVGPKTAAALMQAYESLDDLYLRLDTVRDLPLRGAATLPDRLARHREAAYLARELTRIRCDMPLDVSRADLRRRVPDMPGIDGFCSTNGFGQLLSRQAAGLCG